jgi:catechol 2,3-dioxygenase-like lactoylglutathione lyase family enzyme
MIQPAASKPEFEDACPVFPVADVSAALTFYCERLGFELGWTWVIHLLTPMSVAAVLVSVSR